MKRNRNLTLLTNPWLAWTNLALSATQLAVTSSEVIGLRMNRMLLAGPLPGLRDQAEMALMAGEKTTAAAQSAQAMAFSLFTLNQQLVNVAFRQMVAGVPLLLSWAAALTPAQAAARQARVAAAAVAASASANTKVFSAMPGIAARGLKPVHARARANAKRLRRRTPRRQDGR